MELISGKEVFHAICNGPALVVRTNDGKALQGKEKREEVIKDLLRLPLTKQPDDFQALVRLLDERLR